MIRFFNNFIIEPKFIIKFLQFFNAIYLILQIAAFHVLDSKKADFLEN